MAHEKRLCYTANVENERETNSRITERRRKNQWLKF